MGNATALLISVLAAEARARAACASVFGDPQNWGEPNGVVVRASPSEVRRRIDGFCVWYSTAAPPRERGYDIATGIARAILKRVLSRPTPHDVARLASEILVHRPTLDRIGAEAYAKLAVHVPRRVILTASRGSSIYLV